MPSISYLIFPDITGTGQKSGGIQDSNNIFYPVARFLTSQISSDQTGISGSFANQAIIGGLFTFANAAGSNGWGGAVNGGVIYVNNTLLVNGSLSLMLFSAPIASAITNAGLVTAFNPTATEAKTYLGTINFANVEQFAASSVFSTNNINMPYNCASNGNALYGIAYFNTVSAVTLSAAELNISLQITQS